MKQIRWVFISDNFRIDFLHFSIKTCCGYLLECPPHDKTNKMTVHPAKTQISLGIHPVWSESLLCTQWVAKNPNFLPASSEDSDQTGWMPSLIWVFASCTVILLVLSWGGSYAFMKKYGKLSQKCMSYQIPNQILLSEYLPSHIDILLIFYLLQFCLQLSDIVRQVPSSHCSKLKQENLTTINFRTDSSGQIV